MTSQMRRKDVLSEERTAVEEPIKRWIGLPVRRLEDRRLLTGEAAYLDDLDEPEGCLRMRLVRSPFPHALLTGIDFPPPPERAQVITAADLGSPPPAVHPRFWPEKHRVPSMPLLAHDRVRYSGEPFAAILAESQYVAEDLAETVQGEFEELEAFIDPRSEPGPVLHEDCPHNLYYRQHIRTGDVDALRSAGAMSIRRSLRVARHTGMPIETRGCMAVPSKHGLTMWSSTQMPHIVRSVIAEVLQWDESQVDLRVPEIGGGFGVKGHVYREEVLTAILAYQTGRPVKWVEDRLEHFVGSVHAREHLYDLELVLNGDGRILGLAGSVIIDAGAYPIYPQTGALEAEMTAKILPGPYDVAIVDIETRAVATNKVPLGTYRGVARPSAAFALERLLDEAARELRVDPAQLRLRNAVREFPYRTSTGLEYDEVSVAASIELACRSVDYASIRAGCDRSGPRATGVGLACFVEQTALIPPWGERRHGIVTAHDRADVLIRSDGIVEARVGLATTGQGHETVISQVVADRLGVRPEDVLVSLASTADDAFSMGTLASRSAVVGGSTVATAAGRVARELRERASPLLDVPADDLVLEGGSIHHRGGRGLSFAELAERLGTATPEGVTAISASASYEGSPAGTFSNACHAAVVDIDYESGEVHVRRYVVAHDCGTVINPLVVGGQVQGGVAQGIGGALYEQLVYDDSGQLLTANFMDYALPSPTEVPPIHLHELCTPGRAPLGIKGTGESGAIGPMAAIANAVADAIGDERARLVTEVPLTPYRVWRILHGEGQEVGESSG